MKQFFGGGGRLGEILINKDFCLSIIIKYVEFLNKIY